MPESWVVELQLELRQQKQELEQRLARIRQNHRRPLESDSKERAVQLENSEVVDALGNEATIEIRQITAALQRIDAGEFGCCGGCGEEIARERLMAWPQAEKCIQCAALDDSSNHAAGAAQL